LAVAVKQKSPAALLEKTLYGNRTPFGKKYQSQGGGTPHDRRRLTIRHRPVIIA